MSFFRKLFFYLNPMTFVKVFGLSLDEISNWSYYKRCLKMMKEDGTEKNNRWNVNLDEYSINFVVNLQPEFLLYSENDIRDYEMTVVSNYILECESKLSDIGLFGMVDFNSERIYTSDYYGYGVSGTYKFTKISKGDIIYMILYAAAIAAGITLAIFLI